MTTITAYTYDADVHCIECAEAASADLEGAIDSEGNSVHAIFSTDEWESDMACGTCRGFIDHRTGDVLPLAEVNHSYLNNAESLGWPLKVGL